MKRFIPLVLSVFVAFIFIQSTFFKFSGAEETVIIFHTIADWMISVGLSPFSAGVFGEFGAYGVGAVELIASALILIPATRKLGASISLVVISGAIFFHLFTPLGIDRVVDQAGNTDGGALFFTAVAVWFSSVAVIAMSRYRTRSSANDDSAGADLALA
ncbi:MAG: DoxX family membrane protein [Pseudomonadota bacterium]